MNEPERERLYRLIRLPGPNRAREFRIIAAERFFTTSPLRFRFGANGDRIVAFRSAKVRLFEQDEFENGTISTHFRGAKGDNETRASLQPIEERLRFSESQVDGCLGIPLRRSTVAQPELGQREIETQPAAHLAIGS